MQEEKRGKNEVEAFEETFKPGEDDNDEPFISTFDYKIQNWLERCNTEDLEPVLYVYRFNQNSTSKKTICGKFVGTDLPDEHSIGLMYGSGHYMAAITLPRTPSDKRPKQTTMTFEIDRCYDDMRREAARNGSLPSYTPVGMQNRLETYNAPPVRTHVINNDNSLQQFREGMMFVAELMGKLQSGVPAPSPDINSLLMSQYKSMSELLKNNLLETDQFMHETLRQRNNLPNADEEKDENDDTPMIAKLIPELLPLLSTLMASPKTREIVQTAATSPHIQTAAKQAVSAIARPNNTVTVPNAVKTSSLRKSSIRKTPAIQRKTTRQSPQTSATKEVKNEKNR